MRVRFQNHLKLISRKILRFSHCVLDILDTTDAKIMKFNSSGRRPPGLFGLCCAFPHSFGVLHNEHGESCQKICIPRIPFICVDTTTISNKAFVMQFYSTLFS